MTIEPVRGPPFGFAAVTVSGLGCIAAGSLYGWSALSPAVAARFGVANSETGQAFSLAIFAFTLGALLSPRLGPARPSLRVLGVALGAGAALVFAASFAPGFWAFLGLYSLGFGTCAGVVYITAVGIASQGPHPGWGVPLVVAAFGLGGAAFGALLSQRIAAGMGLAALGWVAAALAATAFPAILKRPPTGTALAVETNFGPPVARRTLARLWMVFAAGSLGGLVALGLAQPIAADRGGGAALAAVVVAVALGNVAGRLGAGLLGLGLSPVRLVGAAQGLGGLALLVLLWPSPPMMTATLLTLVAFGYGLTAAGVPLLTRRTVGPAAFTRAFGITFTGWGAAGLVGPWIAGILRDRTGSWESGIALAAMGSLVALALLATGHWDQD